MSRATEDPSAAPAPTAEIPEASPATLADEVFFFGTGAQVAPCVKIDGRTVGGGIIGPAARAIGDRYSAIAHGDDPAHPECRTPVYR